MSERGKTDWAAVRHSFVSSMKSYRAVAEQFSLAPTTVYRKARAEDWPLQRMKYQETMLQAQAEAEGAALAEGIEKCVRVAQKILERLEALLDDPETVLLAKDIRSYTGAVKDIVDILGTDLDLEKKRAEIEALRAKGAADEGPAVLRVILGEAEEYAQ